MSEQRLEAATGAGVLLIAAGFLFYLVQGTGFARGSGGDGYALTASFRSADGVNVGTDVRLAGVKIGAVREMSLNAETYRAETVLALKAGLQIPDDSAAVIASEGLLGGNYVEIVPGGSLFYLEPGAEIEETQGAVSLMQLLFKFVTGSAEDSST